MGAIAAAAPGSFAAMGRSYDRYFVAPAQHMVITSLKCELIVTAE